VALAERLGWTLAYIDDLDHEAVSDIFAVLGGIAKYQEGRKR
jgi:hypothetical protein